MQTQEELRGPWELLKEFSERRGDFNDTQHVLNQLLTQRLVAYEALHVAMAIKNEADSSKILELEKFWVAKFGFDLKKEDLDKYIDNSMKILSMPCTIDFRIYKINQYLNI